MTYNESGKTDRYLNRDLSWVDFNERVLEEGLRKDLLPLDRFKYLSIVSSNYDEFFMVRVAALKRVLEKTGAVSKDFDFIEYSPDEVLKIISQKTRSIIARQYEALKKEIFPEMEAEGLTLLHPDTWNPAQKEYLESMFLREILPVLTPLRAEPEEPLHVIENYRIHVAFLLEPINEQSGIYPGASQKTSIVQIPPALDRIILFNPEHTGGKVKVCWTLLEDLVGAFGHFLFPGYKIVEQFFFKISRDADFSVDEQRDEDFIEAMEEVLESRKNSMVIRMSYSSGSLRLRDYFASRFNLREDDLFEIDGPLNLGSLYNLIDVPGFDKLREKPWKIYPHPAFGEDRPLWDRINEGDVILHLPYQSFEPVTRFFREAAIDPNVVSIKTTLYRTSENSPIIRALETASLSGKHVTAVVELKARFNEKQNISWANRLEKAGVIVVYGIARLKVHVKAAMVIRKENNRLRRYIHLSTGNYNDKTARIYTDISLFTAREDIAYETGLLFNIITGYSAAQPMRRLVIAPMDLKNKLLFLIKQEINSSTSETPGRIIAKMNALSDPEIIDALYKASRAGVEIMLNVRGICMLKPGISGNIHVVSIIDHNLEHTRICYFANGGADELYLSSADWMPRNLERRIEVMFPILQENTKHEVLEILLNYFRDNTHAWQLDPNGKWRRVINTEEPYRVQTHFLEMAEKAAKTVSTELPGTADTGFIIRRKPQAQQS